MSYKQALLHGIVEPPTRDLSHTEPPDDELYCNDDNYDYNNSYNRISLFWDILKNCSDILYYKKFPKRYFDQFHYDVVYNEYLNRRNGFYATFRSKFGKERITHEGIKYMKNETNKIRNKYLDCKKLCLKRLRQFETISKAEFKLLVQFCHDYDMCEYYIFCLNAGTGGAGGCGDGCDYYYYEAYLRLRDNLKKIIAMNT